MSQNATKLKKTPRLPSPAERELAERELAKRHLLTFTQRMNPKYMAGWVHEDICRRLERFSDDVAAGKSPRLMLLMPPRHGKSELASKMFPAWHLGRNPDHEVIACSYNIALAMTFSKKIKQVFDDVAFQTVFDARLNPDDRSTESWAIEGNSGAYVAAGVGGGITGRGAHCVLGQCAINTPTGYKAAQDLVIGDIVYALNHNSGMIEPSTVLARQRLVKNNVYTITTASGKRITVTGDHPVYVPRIGYIPAENLARGMELLSMAGGDDRNTMLGVCSADIDATRVLARSIEARDQEHELLPGVYVTFTEQGEGMPHVSEEIRRAEPVLFARMHSALAGQGQVRQARPPNETAAEAVPTVWCGVQAQEQFDAVLQPPVRSCGSFGADAGCGEPEFQRGRRVHDLLQEGVEEENNCSGRGSVRGVQKRTEVERPPSGREPAEQRLGELGDSMPRLSYEAPQVRRDTVSSIEVDRSQARFVYDIQTEHGNFLINTIVVHNCLIVDDPLKNAEEADSAATRESVWDWYGSTAYTRLAPGGGVLIIQTLWHDGDLAGKLQQVMKEATEDDDDVDRFEIVKYPAISEQAEFLNVMTDEIVRLDIAAQDSVAALIEAAKLGVDVNELKFLRGKGQPLHEARYDIKKLNRIKRAIAPRFWSALYQQNPVPDDGAFFTKDMFKRGPIPELKNSVIQIAWDFAIGVKKNNDYTVGTVGLLDYDDTLHIADQVSMKSNNLDYIVGAMLDLAQRWNGPSLIIGVEDGQIWKTMESTFMKACRERKFYPQIKVLPPLTDKEVRAGPLRGRMQAGKVSFNDVGEWYDASRTEKLRFPSGVHDDRVDSEAWVAQVAIGRQPPRRPTVKTEKSWRDKLKLGSKGASHMAA